MSHAIFRTKAGAASDAIQSDMEALQLNESLLAACPARFSRLVAIPLVSKLHDEGDISTRLQPSIGMLYVDSEEKDYFIEETRMKLLINMTQRFANSLTTLELTTSGRIANNAFWRGSAPAEEMDLAVQPDNA